jgi:TonB family protein
MSKLTVLVLALSACATGGITTGDRDAAPRTGVRLDLSVTPDDAVVVFPAAIDPVLPSIDRMSHALRARTGAAELTAQLDLCVAPDGHVTKIGLAKSSSNDAFDHALVRDVADWQFTAIPGPANVEACRRATIAYRTH